MIRRLTSDASIAIDHTAPAVVAIRLEWKTIFREEKTETGSHIRNNKAIGALVLHLHCRPFHLSKAWM